MSRCAVMANTHTHVNKLTRIHTHTQTNILCVHTQLQIRGVHKHSKPNVDYLTVQMDKQRAVVCSPLPDLLCV